MSQKGCSVSLNEERALQASHFCISPRHVAALPGYALVMCYSPWEGLREVVVPFVPLSLAVSPSVSVCRLKRSAWLSQDVSLAHRHVFAGGFKHRGAMLTTRLV